MVPRILIVSNLLNIVCASFCASLRAIVFVYTRSVALGTATAMQPNKKFIGNQGPYGINYISHEQYQSYQHYPQNQSQTNTIPMVHYNVHPNANAITNPQYTYNHPMNMQQHQQPHVNTYYRQMEYSQPPFQHAATSTFQHGGYSQPLQSHYMQKQAPRNTMQHLV